MKEHEIIFHLMYNTCYFNKCWCIFRTFEKRDHFLSVKSCTMEVSNMCFELCCFRWVRPNFFSGKVDFHVWEGCRYLKNQVWSGCGGGCTRTLPSSRPICIWVKILTWNFRFKQYLYVRRPTIQNIIEKGKLIWRITFLSWVKHIFMPK